MSPLETASRALCEAQGVRADAPVYISMRACLAWEARTKQVYAICDALGHARPASAMSAGTAETLAAQGQGPASAVAASETPDSATPPHPSSGASK
jgi:hypothetical protein